jgi:myo-inositol-1(or 4)-monophosphatase
LEAQVPGETLDPTVTPDLCHARQVAVEAARAAGRLLSGAAAGPLGARAKDASGDLVTDLDLAAEALILRRLGAAFPTHRIISEEAGVCGAAESSHTWLVDPLDGTNNLAIGLSDYVVGIALCERGRPVVGVVHEPVTGHTWSAVRGLGARDDGGDLRRRPGPPGRRPVLAWTQGHGVARDDSTARALRLVLDSAARRVLQLWAPLLSWVMLARGDIDGFVGYRPEGVDLPAGMLLAREAGVAVRALDGGEYDDRIGLPETARSFVAGRPRIVDRLVKLVTAGAWLEPEVRRLTVLDTSTIDW